MAKFEGFADPRKLEKIIATFLEWAKAQVQDWLTPPVPLTEEERQVQEDLEFYESLKGEVESEPCQHSGCGSNRIRYSVMCGEHHFEMVTKRPAPKKAS